MTKVVGTPPPPSVGGRRSSTQHSKHISYNSCLISFSWTFSLSPKTMLLGGKTYNLKSEKPPRWNASGSIVSMGFWESALEIKEELMR